MRNPGLRKLGGPVACAGFALAFLLWVAAWRGPFLKIVAIDGDEALFWLIGRQWLAGHPPYTTIWDLKPPGLYALFAGIAAVFHDPLTGSKIAAAIAVTLTGFALYRFGAEHLRSRAAGASAALIYVPYTLLMDGLASKPELFMTPLVTAACWASLRAAWADSWRSPLLAGLLFGGAGMLKQTAAFEAGFCFLWLICAPGPRWRRAGLFAAGCAVMPLGFAAYFAGQGLLPEALEASLFAASQRLGGDGVALGEAPLRLLGQLKPAIPLLVAAGLLWTERRRLPQDKVRSSLGFVAGWTGAAALGVLAARATYAAYLLTLLAPLSLAGGAALAAWGTSAARRRWAALAAGLIVVAYPLAYFLMSPMAVLAGDRTAAEVAAAVKARLAPGDAVYVVDYEPAVYALSGARPATRFVLPQHLVCPFPAAGIDPRVEIERVMRSRPRCLVVSAGRRRMACEVPELAQAAIGLGGADYALTGRFGGGLDPVELYCRR